MKFDRVAFALAFAATLVWSGASAQPKSYLEAPKAEARSACDAGVAGACARLVQLYRKGSATKGDLRGVREPLRKDCYGEDPQLGICDPYGYVLRFGLDGPKDWVGAEKAYLRGCEDEKETEKFILIMVPEAGSIPKPSCDALPKFRAERVAEAKRKQREREAKQRELQRNADAKAGSWNISPAYWSSKSRLDILSKAGYSSRVNSVAKAADNGDRNATTLWAMGLDEGVGVTKNHRLAREKYKRAYELGQIRAQAEYAGMLIYGAGGSKDTRTGFRLALDAAKKGNAAGMYFAGLCYYEGHGTRTNRAEAVRWLRASRDAGYAEAAKSLSKISSSSTSSQAVCRWATQEVCPSNGGPCQYRNVQVCD